MVQIIIKQWPITLRNLREDTMGQNMSGLGEGMSSHTLQTAYDH